LILQIIYKLLKNDMSRDFPVTAHEYQTNYFRRKFSTLDVNLKHSDKSAHFNRSFISYWHKTIKSFLVNKTYDVNMST